MGKITQMVEAAGKGDFGDALGSIPQKVFGDFQSIVIQVVNRGLSQITPKNPAAFASADSKR